MVSYKAVFNCFMDQNGKTCLKVLNLFGILIVIFAVLINPKLLSVKFFNYGKN